MPIITEQQADAETPLIAAPLAPPSAAELQAIQLQQDQQHYQQIQAESAVVIWSVIAALILGAIIYSARHHFRRATVWTWRLIDRTAYAAGLLDSRQIAARWQERR